MCACHLLLAYTQKDGAGLGQIHISHLVMQISSTVCLDGFRIPAQPRLARDCPNQGAFAVWLQQALSSIFVIGARPADMIQLLRNLLGLDQQSGVCRQRSSFSVTRAAGGAAMAVQVL